MDMELVRECFGNRVDFRGRNEVNFRGEKGIKIGEGVGAKERGQKEPLRTRTDSKSGEVLCIQQKMCNFAGFLGDKGKRGIRDKAGMASIQNTSHRRPIIYRRPSYNKQEYIEDQVIAQTGNIAQKAIKR